LARHGGDEFAVVLTEADYRQGLAMIDRLHQRVGKKPFQYKDHFYRVTLIDDLSGQGARRFSQKNHLFLGWLAV
jgi:GGDEF domain-containing protein